MKQKLDILLRKRDKILQGILAFAGTYGCLCLGEIAGISTASFSVVGLLLFVGIYGMLSRTRRKLAEIFDVKRRRRRVRYAAVMSYLFSLSMFMGYQLQMTGMMESGFRGKGLILLRGACLNIAFFPFWNLLFSGIERIGFPAAEEKETKPWREGAVFGVCTLAILLCLVPVWLAYYPIVMSYDFHRQVNEAAKGFVWFYPYQPLAHTWVIWLFLQLGYRLGSLEAGFGYMALFHMLSYSLTAAYSCVFLYRVTRKKWPVVAATLFFGVLPLNTVMVVCTTKDVLFTILLLLFHLLLAERFFYSDSSRKQLVMDVLILIEGCVMIQFRNNALYAVAAYAVIWVICAARREKLRVLLLCVLLVVGGKGMAIGIKEALGTEITAPKVEMYSVPIQQLARVGYYHAEELDPKMRETINAYVPAEDGKWEYYMAGLADPAKTNAGNIFQELQGEGIVRFVKDWLYVGVHYPNEYIDAFLELTRGYWFLDDRSYAEYLGWGVEGRMGVLYTYNSALLDDGTDIVHESKFPWLEEQLEKVISGNAFYHWPVVSILFKSSFYFWGLFVVFVAYLYRHKRKQMLFVAFILVYMATVLLGPIVQIRYAFPAMVVFPLLIGLLCYRENEKGNLER